MNDRELAQFRQLIEKLLLDLREDDGLGRDSQKIVELDQQSVGRLSRIDALQNQAMAKATQARRDLLSKRLAAALKRLELDPAATKCISCASG